MVLAPMPKCRISTVDMSRPTLRCSPTPIPQVRCSPTPIATLPQPYERPTLLDLEGLPISRVNWLDEESLHDWFQEKTVAECLVALKSLEMFEKSCQSAGQKSKTPQEHTFRGVRDSDNPQSNIINQNLAHTVAARGHSVGGSVELLRKLRQMGVPLNLVDNFGQTPLFYAARENDVRSCQLLIGAKCSVSRLDDRYRETCLFYAVQELNDEEDRQGEAGSKRRRDTVSFLLQQGASVTLRNQLGQTVLDVCAQSPNPDATLVDLLHGSCRKRRCRWVPTVAKRLRVHLSVDKDKRIWKPSRPSLPTSDCALLSSLRALSVPELLPDVINYAHVYTQLDREGEHQTAFAEKDRRSLFDLREVAEKRWRIGVSCRKGDKIGYANQDAFVMIHCTGMFSLYGVFDGHGKNGHLISDFVRDVLPKLFLYHSSRATDPELALRESFLQCQRLIEADVVDAARSGTTATLAYRPAGEDYVILAHVGDSTACLLRDDGNGVVLTQEHKPNYPLERRRIEESGGVVEFDGHFNYRVFSGVDGVPIRNGSSPWFHVKYSGGLNMSRVLGDVAAHRYAGVTAVPTIERYTIDQHDKALLLCSDGVWEFIDARGSAAIVHEFNLEDAGQLQQATDALVEESYRRWKRDDDDFTDDITALLIRL